MADYDTGPRVARIQEEGSPRNHPDQAAVGDVKGFPGTGTERPAVRHQHTGILDTVQCLCRVCHQQHRHKMEQYRQWTAPTPSPCEKGGGGQQQKSDYFGSAGEPRGGLHPLSWFQLFLKCLQLIQRLLAHINQNPPLDTAADAAFYFVDILKLKNICRDCSFVPPQREWESARNSRAVRGFNEREGLVPLALSDEPPP